MTDYENLDEQIRLTEERLAWLRAKRDGQIDCNHIWGEIKYAPEKKEIYVQKGYWKGVDWMPYTERTGLYEDVPRWKRTCTKCGKTEYTYQQEEVVTKKPKF